METVVRSDLQFTMVGDQLSPKELERLAGVQFSRRQEVGDIAERGRYAGRPIPYGSGTLFADDADAALTATSMSFIDAVERLVRANTVPLDRRVIHLNVGYRGQCNIEIAPRFFERLARLEIYFTLSCYELEAPSS